MINGLAALAYQRLGEIISAPEWADGGRLPPEEELARTIGVSRPVLRRALALLRSEGRVSSRRGSGNYIEPLPGSDAGAFSHLPIRNIRDLEHCMSFRLVIEIAIAGEAAERADELLIAAMETANSQVSASLPQGSLFEADFEFHLALARGSRNPYLLAALEGLRRQIRISFELGRKMRSLPLTEASRRVAAEHELILDAIRSKDTLRARHAIEAHIGGTIRRFFGSGI
ncbi:FCD domain-containing protein [Pararhodobacter sp. SW119]|uniref:FadR/GntR family transcriptional regulator n=1 Tax=Pararhodobacter sp. SW119 TaxID=2780075 RepID=UPI001ADED8EB|nr:FCD domain-containing protein [Pararhodobacter sp. SW119]